MSDWHYYRLKDDSKYKNTTIEDCNKELEKFQNNLANDRIIFIANMINMYYEEDLSTKYSKIKWGLSSLTYNPYVDYEYLKELLENDGNLSRNHSHSKYLMEETVSEYEDVVREIIKRLMILATVKFVSDERYSDTPKTIMEYLSGEFITKVEEELDYLSDITEEYTFDKFILENCEEVCDE